MRKSLKALVVGINDYPKSRLHGCINDATEFKNLIARNGDGSPNFEVRLETTVGTKSVLKEMISKLFAGDCDTIVLYFSGHGFVSELGGYIVTPDYKAYDEGVSMDEILKLANKSKAKDKIIILDCCYSGAIGQQKVGDHNAIHIAEGVTILTSSRDIETSAEINGHGVFTNLLLEALRGGAADVTGHISPGSIYAYIDSALGEWDQRPVFKSNVTRFTSLRTVIPSVPPDILRKLTIYFKKPDQELGLDPSFEDTNSNDKEHNVIKPYADPENVAIFKHLQKFQSVGLVVPVNADYMYFAAMNSKSCKLTALGYHYWKLVKEDKI